MSVRSITFFFLRTTLVLARRLTCFFTAKEQCSTSETRLEVMRSAMHVKHVKASFCARRCKLLQ